MKTKLIKVLDYFAFKRLSNSTIKFLGKNSAIAYRKISARNHCELSIGSHSIIEGAILFDKDEAKVSVGDRTFIGASTLVCADNITIGDDVLISWGCTIVDHDSHSIDFHSRSKDVENWLTGFKNWTNVKVGAVHIMDKVWLGFNVIVLKGVTIGEGAVVGAGSVVTKNVKPYTIVAGNPAREIRTIESDER